MLGVLAHLESGTWWARHVPSTGRPSTCLGPVQPFGLRSTIIGPARAALVAVLARGALELGDHVERLVEHDGEAPVHRRVVVVRVDVDADRVPAVDRGRTRSSSSAGMRASTVGLAIL